MSNGTPVGAVLRRLAEQDPERPAVTCGEATVSRRAFEDRTNRLARALLARGAGAGSTVAIVLPNSVALVEALFATWKAGATPMPVSPALAGRERAAVLDLAAPAVVIESRASGGPSSEDPGSGVPASEGPGTVGTARTLVPDDGQVAGLPAEPLPDAVALPWKILPSGGSTGRPKLIASPRPAVIEEMALFALLAQQQENGTVLVPGPLTHNGPFLAAVGGVLFGSHLVLTRRFDPAETLRLVDEHRADWLYAVPTMMHRIWRLPDEIRRAADLGSLRIAFHLGSPCPPWLKEAWIDWLGPKRIWELYAGTEAQAVTVIDGAEWLDHRGSVGRPVTGEIEIRDREGRRLPPGEVGEVWMRPDAGSDPTYRYVGAKPRAAADGWESLGDLGYVDADGYLYLTDRDADMILVGGANVYPAEVEAALEEHPQVLSSAVIGLPDDDLGSVPHALVHLGAPVSDDDLREHAAARLAPYKRPRTFERVDRPLRDDAGKVRRSALRAARITPHSP